MTHTPIYNADELRNVPDGTIISWLRIPGDPASAAVAFVNHEIEQEVDLDGRPTGHTGPITWISPGGWQSMTLEESSVTFPAEVLRWGGHMVPAAWPEPLPFTELPLLPRIGGTSSRQVALECAARAWQGMRKPSDDEMIATAEAFEKWLDREDAQ